ncbi:MAG: DUF362 domain-containing protein [Chloroflexi bacterium]|nr:DUF362 domain-containing protein [Chloroflexota bacterium]
MSRVALFQGDDRAANITSALEAIAEDVDLAGKRRIVVKPNFVSIHNPLSATHVDATRAVLGYLCARGARDITLAEGPAAGSATEGFANYGYLPLIEEYGLKVVDLNRDDHVLIEVLDQRLRPKMVRVSRTVVESDYRVSVGPPKTHDEVMVTMSLKNYAVGSVVGKRSIHEGHKAINLNLYRLARVTAPHLAVIDGFVGMEGDGPTRGTAVEWHLALASTDPLAADCLAARLMGFDPHSVGYLHYCLLGGLGEGEPEQITVVGNTDPDRVRRPFRPHRTIESQRRWQVPDAARYL